MHISEVILASLIVSSYSDDLSFKTNVSVSRFQPHGYLLSPDFPLSTNRFTRSNITLYNVPDDFKVIRISILRLELQPPSTDCRGLFLYVYTANRARKRICKDNEIIIGEKLGTHFRVVTFELATYEKPSITLKFEYKFFKDLLMSDGDVLKEDNEGYIFGEGGRLEHLVLQGFNPFATVSLLIHSEWPCYFYGITSVGDGFSQLTFDYNLTESQNITTQTGKLMIYFYSTRPENCLLLAYQVIDEGCSKNIDGKRMLDAIYKEGKLSYNMRCPQGYTLNRHGDDELRCVNHTWSNPGECVNQEEQNSLAIRTYYKPALIGLAIITCVVLVAIIILVKYRLMERCKVNQANKLDSSSGMLIASVGDHSPKETDRLRSSAALGSKDYKDPESAIMEDYYNANATMKHEDPRNDNYASITVETKKKKASAVVDTLVDNDIYEGDA